MVFIQRMAHKNWLFLLTIMLLSSAAMRADAEAPEAREIFQKMAEAFRTVDFKGRFTFMSQAPEGSQIREARMIRKAPNKICIELLWPAEERGTVMVMNGKERWHVQGEKAPERVRGRRPFLPPNRMAESLLKEARLLLRNYGVQVFEGGHVAGRSAYLVEIDSKTRVRPSAKIWVHKETGVILRTEHYDSQKRLRDLLIYSRIDFHPEIDEAMFQRPDEVRTDRGPGGGRDREEIWNSEQGELDLEKIREAAQLSVVVPEQAPSGFTLQNIQIIKFGERKSVQLSYTDGLATLSVFQSSSDEGGRDGRRGGLFRRRREGRRQDMPPWRGGRMEKMDIRGTGCEMISRGPMCIFRWNNNGVYITLMGELERKEMIKIADSFISNAE